MRTPEAVHMQDLATLIPAENPGFPQSQQTTMPRALGDQQGHGGGTTLGTCCSEGEEDEGFWGDTGPGTHARVPPTLPSL